MARAGGTKGLAIVGIDIPVTVPYDMTVRDGRLSFHVTELHYCKSQTDQQQSEHYCAHNQQIERH